MDKFIITGGNKLIGEVCASGAKNSALALLPACILNGATSKIFNAPRVNDVYTMLKLLEQIGCETKFSDNIVEINSKFINNQIAPYELVKKMRASIYVLGPLLARFGYAKVSLPGGCAWGPRPVNLHLEAMSKLGAEIEIEEGYIIAKANKLIGTKINFDISSVGATGNALMAATLAKGTTIITNAALEPEIQQLAEFLNLMGAKINGIGTTTLEIEGVDELRSAEISVIPDRIEGATLLTAAAITRGKIRLNNSKPAHMMAALTKFEDAGFKLEIGNDFVFLDATDIDEIKPVNITTAPYPGFPTDMQAQWIALMCLANGTSTVTDTIYFDRFKHVPELNRLGANIEVKENSAIVKGPCQLKGAKVMSTDLRASASLVLAGLAAVGKTEVLRVYHLDRGYEEIEKKLEKLGAQIERVDSPEY